MLTLRPLRSLRETLCLPDEATGMRIGIISDTHDQADRTRHALDMLSDAGAETFFHCGDFVDASILNLMVSKPCYFVFGNNDADSISELRETASATGAICLEWGGTVTLAGKRIAMTHGHLASEVRPLLTSNPDYFLSGHSHYALDSHEGKTRCINPGALFRAAKFTAACLDLVTDKLELIEIPPIRTSLSSRQVSLQKNKHGR
jgi:uncharacterized protein